MLLANVPRHPDDYAGLEASSIRNELPKMGMISVFKLVLYYHAPVASQVTGEYIDGEIPHRLLASDDFKVKSEHRPDYIDVLY